MTAETDITAINDGGANTALEVRSALTSVLARADTDPFLTTKGDLLTHTTGPARLGVGANDTVLTADSAEPSGVKWATPVTGGWTELGSQTLVSAGNLLSIPFSNPSGTYQELRYEWYVSGFNVGADFRIGILNSGTHYTGSNYYYRQGINGGVASAATTNEGWRQFDITLATTGQYRGYGTVHVSGDTAEGVSTRLGANNTISAWSGILWAATPSNFNGLQLIVDNGSPTFNSGSWLTVWGVK